VVLDPGPPAETLVVFDERARREELPVVAPVDDPIRVTERHVRRLDPVVHEESDLLQATRAVRAVGQDRAASPSMGGGSSFEDTSFKIRQGGLAAGDLDHPGPVGCPLDSRPHVVVFVNPALDVGNKSLGEFID
jgi:hypothetical protein